MKHRRPKGIGKSCGKALTLCFFVSLGQRCFYACRSHQAQLRLTPLLWGSLFYNHTVLRLPDSATLLATALDDFCPFPLEVFELLSRTCRSRSPGATSLRCLGPAQRPPRYGRGGREGVEQPATFKPGLSH